jgi:hypothetical protein
VRIILPRHRVAVKPLWFIDCIETGGGSVETAVGHDFLLTLVTGSNSFSDKESRLSCQQSALKWAQTQDNPNDAWTTCPRGDWLLYLAVRLGVEHRAVVLAAWTCARLGLPYTRDERPLQAILMTEAWVLGDKTVTAQDVRGAAKECDGAAGYAECFAEHAAASAADAAMYATIAACPARRRKERLAMLPLRWPTQPPMQRPALPMVMPRGPSSSRRAPTSSATRSTRPGAPLIRRGMADRRNQTTQRRIANRRSLRAAHAPDTNSRRAKVYYNVA